MAKQILPTTFKDDIVSSAMNGRRKYNMIQNDDGTVSFEDVTEYTQVGSNFGAAQINATNGAVNECVGKDSVIDSLLSIATNSDSGKVAGALAVKELNDKITIEEYVVKGVIIPKSSFSNAACAVKSKAGYSQAIPLFVKFKNSADGGKQESSSNCYRIAFGTESGEDVDDNVYVFLRNVSTAYDAKVDVYFCIIYIK